jgi:transcriptional regulator with XRE-family HTH domain
MLERGQRSPPLETIEKMARALGVPPATLLGGR